MIEEEIELSGFGLEFSIFGRRINPIGRPNKNKDSDLETAFMNAEQQLDQILNDSQGRQQFYSLLSGVAPGEARTGAPLKRQQAIHLTNGIVVPIDLDAEKVLAESSFAERLNYRLRRAFSSL